MPDFFDRIQPRLSDEQKRQLRAIQRHLGMVPFAGHQRREDGVHTFTAGNVVVMTNTRRPLPPDWPGTITHTAIISGDPGSGEAFSLHEVIHDTASGTRTRHFSSALEYNWNGSLLHENPIGVTRAMREDVGSFRDAVLPRRTALAHDYPPVV